MAFCNRPLSPHADQSGADLSFSPRKDVNQCGHRDSKSAYFEVLDDVRNPSPEVDRPVRDLAVHYGGVVNDDEVHHGHAPCDFGDACHDDIDRPRLPACAPGSALTLEYG